MLRVGQIYTFEKTDRFKILEIDISTNTVLTGPNLTRKYYTKDVELTYTVVCNHVKTGIYILELVPDCYVYLKSLFI